MYCGVDQRVAVVDRLPRLVHVLYLWLREGELLGTCNAWNDCQLLLIANTVFFYGIFDRHFEVPISPLVP